MYADCEFAKADEPKNWRIYGLEKQSLQHHETFTKQIAPPQLLSRNNSAVKPVLSDFVRFSA
jgi:hypothetical protein